MVVRQAQLGRGVTILEQRNAITQEHRHHIDFVGIYGIELAEGVNGLWAAENPDSSRGYSTAVAGRCGKPNAWCTGALFWRA